MVRVEFLGPIDKEPLELDISSLDQLSEILRSDEKVVHWLDTCAVALNDTMIKDKNIIFKHGDKISLLPPVCGG